MSSRFPGWAEQPGAAGAGFAHRRTSPGVAAVPADADQRKVAAVTAVTAGPGACAALAAGTAAAQQQGGMAAGPAGPAVAGR